MTVENRGLQVATKVWTLEALLDGTVVSGDSLGHVQIWDGRSGTLTQTFDHNEDGADVFCLAVSEDEDKIFVSGVDARAGRSDWPGGWGGRRRGTATPGAPASCDRSVQRPVHCRERRGHGTLLPYDGLDDNP
jgi:WD40 repeat protein